MKKVLPVLLLALAPPTMAVADGITMTAGYIQLGQMTAAEPRVRVGQLYSPARFSWAGTIHEIVDPALVKPGGAMPLDFLLYDFSGGDVVLHGTEYEARLDPEHLGEGALSLRLTSPSVPAPPAGGEALVSVPFTLRGSFAAYPLDDARSPRVSLDGSGTAYVYFNRFTDPDTDYWWVSGYRWEFGEAAPVSEPATLVLTASGLVGLVSRARRRREAGRRRRS